MPAGRDLDVLVAQYVMGWKVTDDWDDVEDAETTGATVFYVGEFSDGTYGEVWIGERDAGIFSPSRYIQDAWSVQERMSSLVLNEDVYDFGHLHLERLGFRHGWAASFDTIIDDEEWFEHVEEYPRSARGETAPLAICRASLLACSLLPTLPKEAQQNVT
jgi:hypothetical protein